MQTKTKHLPSFSGETHAGSHPDGGCILSCFVNGIHEPVYSLFTYIISSGGSVDKKYFRISFFVFFVTRKFHPHSRKNRHCCNTLIFVREAIIHKLAAAFLKTVLLNWWSQNPHFFSWPKLIPQHSNNSFHKNKNTHPLSIMSSNFFI